jgi:hypothetical protein
MEMMGEVRPGRIRKAGQRLWVLSFVPVESPWGWRDPSESAGDFFGDEQVWVHVVDLSTPAAPRKAGQIALVEQGRRGAEGGTVTLDLQDVGVTATGTGVLALESWASFRKSIDRPGVRFENGLATVATLLEMSEDGSTIRKMPPISMTGRLVEHGWRGAPGTGVFWAVMACGAAEAARCEGSAAALETWKLTAGTPVRLARLPLAASGIALRDVLADPGRGLVFAVTAPGTLQVVDLGDPGAPVLGARLDGLSAGVVRLVGEERLAVVAMGESPACPSASGAGGAAIRLAVSLVDVRRRDQAHLAASGCVAVEAEGLLEGAVVDSEVQVVAFPSAGDVRLLAVPIAFKAGVRARTALAFVSVDLRSAAPDGTPPRDPIRARGSLMLEGRSRWLVDTSHAGAPVPPRVVVSGSEGELSISDLQDLDRPTTNRVTADLPPSIAFAHRFGEFEVEVEAGTGTARVRRVGDSPSSPAVATFQVGPSASVVKHGSHLLLAIRAAAGGASVTVYDLTDPHVPRRVAEVEVPAPPSTAMVLVSTGLVFQHGITYDFETGASKMMLVHLDVSAAGGPRVDWRVIEASNRTHFVPGLVADANDPHGFWVNLTREHGRSDPQAYKPFAQRWSTRPLAVSSEVNLPGALLWTGAPAGRRLHLTRAGEALHVLNTRSGEYGSPRHYFARERLALLGETVVAGRPSAELLDARTFDGQLVAPAIVSGEQLVMNLARWGQRLRPGPAPYGATWETASDRLVVLDFSAQKLAVRLDQPTRLHGLAPLRWEGGRLFAWLHEAGLLVMDLAVGVPGRVRLLPGGMAPTVLEIAGDDLYRSTGPFESAHVKVSEMPLVPVE